MKGVGFIETNGEDICLCEDGSEFGVFHQANVEKAWERRLVSYRIFGVAHLRFYGKPSPKQLQKLRELNVGILFEYWKDDEFRDMPGGAPIGFFQMIKILRDIYKL